MNDLVGTHGRVVPRVDGAARRTPGLRALRRTRAAELAAQQHGVVSRAQLLGLGFSPSAVDRAIRAGELRVVHAGVYVLGPLPVTWRGRLMAAVLAAGPGAAVSHRSAAQLHGLLDGGAGPVHVVTPRRGPRRPGVRGHRARALGPDDVTEVDGIPVVTVARALLDLAADGRPGEAERAWRRADQLRVLDTAAIARVLVGGRRGAAVVRRLAHEAAGGAFGGLTRNELELLFVEAAHVGGLPVPVMNAPMVLAGRPVVLDAVWWHDRVVVELDGWETHGTRAAFEADRQRDAELLRAGYRVVRFTWRRVVSEPDVVVATLRDVLRRPAR
ncbi:type IV toxin-antitoxin system AbiEi family antitoxin domain-containing protein [Patulibacter sp. SYSU D01012]|uniref:type IV toxin-antitoxin system AbiEi family antitoxin domain-containing protein n=1 Tax=Patulibacter sp. SYSU D01012 TaxID=2817381 RepID=UPI001B3037EF|nr:type IV toxin-antitoxin system AbiEi family antitoxin domain-containing protein [Patulibacter sp. SYSU D01012]